MFKKGLLTLLALGMLPVFAGEVENALAKGDKVFLYLYTPQCSFCKQFAPTYDKLSKSNSQYTFIKADAYTRYGAELMRKYRGAYVPYVLLIKPDKAVQLLPNCLSSTVCIEKEMKNF